MNTRIPLLIAACAGLLFAIAPTASAASSCVARDVPNGYGGVVGLTYQFAADTANSACEPDTNAGTYADTTCVYLWGVDCDHLDDQAIETANFECRWLTGADCL